MNQSVTDVQSLRALAQQSTNHLCWIVFSPFVILTNVLVIVTIVLTRSLHNKSQFLIMSHCFAEVLFGCTYLGLGSQRYTDYVFSVPETSTQFMCIIKQYPLVLFGNMVKTFALVLAIDRFICLARPIFYKNRNAYKYAMTFNVIAWAFCLIKIPFAFASYDPNKYLPVCAYATSFDPGYMNYTTIETNVIAGVTVGIYLISAAILFRRYRATTFAGESQKSEWKRQMEFDVFIAVAMIAAIYMASSYINTILATIASRYGTLEVSLILSPIVSVLAFISSISHLFVYLKLNKIFRKSFRSVVLRRQDNSVTALY